MLAESSCSDPSTTEGEGLFKDGISCGCDQSNWENMNLSLTSNPLPDVTLPRSSSSTLPPNSLTSCENLSNFLSSLGLLEDLSLGAEGTKESSLVYESLFPSNISLQPPMLRELIHPSPHGQDLGGHQENETSEITADMKRLAIDGYSKDVKLVFATEMERRQQLNDKFRALRSLVPNPIKSDRASIVRDAIVYIIKLKRTVNLLKILVEKKRCSREKPKIRHIREDGAEGNDVKTEDDLDQTYNGSSLRSSRLHRKSKNTEVDVRIIDDEVTVKLVQQKRINCMLFVSKVLDELQLDLHYVAGGLIGDYYSFLFNSKICKGSTVYAHAIANKLIEVVDKQYAAVQPTSSY